MTFEVAESPTFDELSEEYSPDIWDTAWVNLQRAYEHARISYQLREQQGGWLYSTTKEVLDAIAGGDGEPNASYNGTTYLVPYSTGKSIAEEVLNGTPSWVNEVRQPVEEIHQQDITMLENDVEKISGCLNDLEFATDASYVRREIDSILEDLGEDHWNSNLARIVREEAVNKIERAVGYLHNGMSVLEYNLRIHQEAQQKARTEVYSHLLESIAAFKGIADAITANVSFNYTEFREITGDLASAIAKGANPMTRGLAVADLIQMTTKPNKGESVENPADLMRTLEGTAIDVRDSFDTAIENAATNLDEYFQFQVGISLTDLTLPEAGSIFQ